MRHIFLSIILLTLFIPNVYAQTPTMPLYKMEEGIKDVKAQQKVIFEQYQVDKANLDAEYEKKMNSMNQSASDFKAVLALDDVKKEFQKKKKDLLKSYRDQHNALKKQADSIRGRNAEIVEEVEKPIARPIIKQKIKDQETIRDKLKKSQGSTSVRDEYYAKKKKAMKKKSGKKGIHKFQKKKTKRSAASKKKLLTPSPGKDSLLKRRRNTKKDE